MYTKQEFKAKKNELLEKIEELIHEGNIRHIIIRDPSGKVRADIPLNFGIAGTLLAPHVVLIGVAAGAAARYTVEYLKEEQQE